MRDSIIRKKTSNKDVFSSVHISQIYDDIFLVFSFFLYCNKINLDCGILIVIDQQKSCAYNIYIIFAIDRNNLLYNREKIGIKSINNIEFPFINKYIFYFKF